MFSLCVCGKEIQHHPVTVAHMLGFLTLIWRDRWEKPPPHYHFNSPDYYSTHRLSSSFENLITAVQDKNSLARLSQCGCDPDDCARRLHRSFNPDSQTHSCRNTQRTATETHTHFMSVTNPEIDGSRNTDTELAPLFWQRTMWIWSENKEREPVNVKLL